MDNVVLYNSPAKPATYQVIPNAIMEWDGNGNAFANTLQAGVLQSTGSLNLAKSAVVTATGTLDILSTVKRFDCTTGSQTQTLPASATVSGTYLVLKRLDAGGNTLTIQGSGGTELIDGATTLAIGAKGHAVIYANGTGWDVVG